MLAYFVIYSLPAPCDALPFTEWILEAHALCMRTLVVGFAELALGLEISVFPAGSGDTTYNYVELLVVAILAATGAAAAIWLSRGRAITAANVERVRAYLRWVLGAALLSYGWAKAPPLQMPAPGPERLVMSFADASPMGLLWTFMGASAAYQVFSGLIEVVAGGLLLVRRTSLAGALMASVVLLNVVALNLCYDVPVKLYSMHLLAMALLLVAPHAPRFVRAVLLESSSVAERLPRRRRWAALASLGAWLALQPLVESLGELEAARAELAGSAWHGVWRVERFERGGLVNRELADGERWVRVGLNAAGLAAIQRADGHARRQLVSVDPERGELVLSRREEPDPIPLAFAQPAHDVLELSGEFEGAPIVVRLVREPAEAALLASRGFRWISEKPFNR